MLYGYAFFPYANYSLLTIPAFKQTDMKKLRLLLLFGLLCTAHLLHAQGRAVSGTVTDSLGIKMPNVSVQVKNSRVGTKTNDQGAFTLQLPANNSTLVISSVGYETEQITAPASGNLLVTLKPNRQNLQEVVVTALGITKERRSLGYATQTVKTEAIVDKGETSLLNALQGKLAGADIVGSSGAAGASTSIILRGITSFTGNQSPLFVVDGIPISDATDESTISLYTNQSSNRSSDLNVNNIESVNVLQGPAAAALYGSRAAHGAIMITTKKGSGRRGVLDVTFNSSYSQQRVYGFPELQNKYGQGTNGVFNPTTTFSLGPAFGSTPNLFNGLIAPPNTTYYVNGAFYTAGQTVPFQAYPDNILGYFKQGQIFENNLTINTGDNRNNFGATIGNSQQDGILPNSSFKKTNVGFNISNYLTDKLSVKASVTYFATVQQGPTQGSNGSYSAYANVYRIPRSVDFNYYKNNYTTPGGYNNWFIPNIYNPGIQDSSAGAAGDNPYFAAYKNPIRSNISRVLGNVTLGYDIRSWLNVSYRVGLDTYTDRRKRSIAIGSSQVVRSVFTNTSGTTTGGIMEDVYYRNELNGDLMITAKKNDIFLHGLNANLLLGHGINQQKFQQVDQTGYGLAIPNYYNISNASNLSLTNEYEYTKRLWGIYGSLSLAYNNYLFLELTGRQDHSSTLPAAKNAFFYPSASLSFVLTDALKMNSNVLSFAKVRAAYARVGIDPPVYSLDNVYTTGSAGNNVSFYQFPFGSISGFSISTALGNKGLTPEFTSTLDLGVNIGLFKNRLNIDATVYNSKSTDQIVAVALPASTGYLNKYLNIGAMTNKGLELTVSGTPIRWKDFSWNVSGNFSFNRNKVTAIAPGVTSFSFGGVAFSGLAPTIAVGEPYGIIRGSKFVTNDAGQRLVDSTTGYYLNYKSDQTVLDPNRDWIAGLTNTFSYKHFTFSALVDYKKGGEFESFTVSTLRALGALKVTEDRDQPFVLPGVIDMGNGKYRPNNIQINGQNFYNVALGGSTGSTTSNEFAVFDATTFRVREVSISYDLSGPSVNTKIFKNIRLTVFGRNLYFYAPNSPIDPELSTQGASGVGSGTATSGGLVRGLELGSAPNTRNIGISLRATF
ncbi:SusC/RagA family TonB-linked outer membrane protein [Flavisolibacter ginsenosidimutans]